ncbi:MAG: hypothetical protein N2169_06940 [bacterium]|nr:hypothetical protein [bacterium]
MIIGINNGSLAEQILFAPRIQNYKVEDYIRDIIQDTGIVMRKGDNLVLDFQGFIPGKRETQVPYQHFFMINPGKPLKIRMGYLLALLAINDENRERTPLYSMSNADLWSQIICHLLEFTTRGTSYLSCHFTREGGFEIPTSRIQLNDWEMAWEFLTSCFENVAKLTGYGIPPGVPYTVKIIDSAGLLPGQKPNNPRWTSIVHRTTGKTVEIVIHYIEHPSNSGLLSELWRGYLSAVNTNLKILNESCRQTFQ